MLSSKWRLALVAALALLISGGATLAQGEPTTQQGTTLAPTTKKVRVKVKWYRIRKTIPHYGAFYTRPATWYSTEGCDTSGGGGSTSMSTTPRFGEVAVLPGDLPLGTWIWFTKSIHRSGLTKKEQRQTQGGRLFHVEDHISSGSTLDIWMHCSWTGGWGNTSRSFFIVHWSHRWVQRYRWVWKTVVA